MLIIRLTVAAALLSFFGAVAAIVVAGSERHPLAQDDARFIRARLLDFDQGVRTQLVRLRPDAGPARAEARTRDAIIGINALARGVDDAAGADADLLRVAIAGELRFLDAVGSVLVNPRSPRLTGLAALDVAARRAIAAVAGPRARRTGGVTALLRLRGAGPPQRSAAAAAAA